MPTIIVVAKVDQLTSIFFPQKIDSKNYILVPSNENITEAKSLPRKEHCCLKQSNNNYLSKFLFILNLI